MPDCDVESGAWSCSLVAGLIGDTPLIEGVLDRISEQAANIISRRLCRMIAGEADFAAAA